MKFRQDYYQNNPIDLSVRFLFCLWRNWFRLYNRIEVQGIENIPKEGPLIVAANHISNADPMILCSFTGLVRRINIITKKELKDIPLAGTYLGHAGSIFVDRQRGGGDLGALRGSLQALKGGGCLVIFPEGTRVRDGKKSQPKSGIGLLAHKSGAKVLPVRIFNSINCLKLGKIVLRYGSTRTFDAPPGADLKESYAGFSETVMKDIFSIN